MKQYIKCKSDWTKSTNAAEQTVEQGDPHFAKIDLLKEIKHAMVSYWFEIIYRIPFKKIRLLLCREQLHGKNPFFNIL